MIEIMTVGDIIKTPKGIVIGGKLSSYNGVQSLQESLEEMSKKPKNMSFILYKDRTGNYNKILIKDSQFTTSVRDTINLFFLLGNIDLPQEIKEGSTIYRA